MFVVLILQIVDMLRMCTNCPGKAALHGILCDIFNTGFELEEDTIIYEQWVSTERSSLITIQSTVSEFIENASCMIYELCPLHYIKDAQSSYLKSLKENLASLYCINFAEFC